MTHCRGSQPADLVAAPVGLSDSPDGTGAPAGGARQGFSSRPLLRIGIDPGKSGGIAILRPDGRNEVHDTPVDGKAYLVGSMVDLLRTARDEAQAQGWTFAAILEYQQAMPGQGVSTMFVCGVGFGLWQGVLTALDIPYVLVRPAMWKRKLGLSSEKASSIALAQQRFPALAYRLLKSKDGRAEALLLATLVGIRE